MSVAARLERELGAQCVGALEHPDLSDAVPLATPTDERAIADALRLAAHEGWKVLPIGSASKVSWTRPAERVDFAISTRGLTGITAYEPGDGTLSARAGSTIEELRAAARANGHHLTPDVARPSFATLGGVLAAAQSGLDRTRHGPVRNHVLGMRVATADGRITKTGGRLVKNVTGYDLHRLYCGSHGTLCVIVEASLRLFAGPEVELAIECEVAGVDAARTQLAELSRAGLDPYAVRLERESRAWTLHVLLNGRADKVAWERAAVLGAMPSARVIATAETQARFTRLRDAESRDASLPRLCLTCVPSRLADVVERVDRAADELGVRARLMLEPTTGVADVAFEPRNGAAPATESFSPTAFARAVRELASNEVTIAVHGGGADHRRAVDPPRIAPSALRVMQDLARALDPTGVLAKGRIHPAL